jgi:hypothetical protein
MTVIVRQPRSLPSFAYQKMAEGARFENPDALDVSFPVKETVSKENFWLLTLAPFGDSS